MIRVLFVCHGNIARSPMAQYIFQKLVDEKGLNDKFIIASAATSREEMGNDIYTPAKSKLIEKGIPFNKHKARQIKSDEYDKWDYILLMDKNNERNIKYIISDDKDNKIHRLLEDKDVADPWYTGNFEVAYNDIFKGCNIWLYKIIKDNNIY